MKNENRRIPIQRHQDPYKGREDAYARQEEDSGMIEGRNAVIEALRAGQPIDKIYIAKGDTDAALGHIASKARDAGTVVVETDRRKLDAMSVTHAHQGVIALAAVKEYCTVQDILNAAAEREKIRLSLSATRYPTTIISAPSSEPLRRPVHTVL